jgi:hypothetical protein
MSIEVLHCRNCGNLFDTEEPAYDCCSESCKRALHRRLLGQPPEQPVPYSTPHSSVMRSALSPSQERARAEVLAARNAAPRPTTSVREGFLKSADQALPGETARYNEELEADMLIKRVLGATRHPAG